MIKKGILFILFLLGIFNASDSYAQQDDLAYENSKPWVYWYWMHSAYSKEGITADLEAMKDAGIAGAYLMTIKGPTDPPLIDPPVLQLSPEFWEMVGFALKEANRLDLQIAMHAADGFAVAGGPWIEPEQSMQKVVYTDTILSGGKDLKLKLEQPESIEHYYMDIATFAIPQRSEETSSAGKSPKVTSTKEDVELNFLTSQTKNDEFKLSEKGWVQYEFDEPFLCKSIRIETNGVNYQAHRLKILVSDDGEKFKELGRLTAPRHGWQDWGIPYTHSIEPVKAKYFRFVYDPEGSEPGSEDLDAGKWKQSLKVSKIILSNQPKIGNYEGKSGLVWRISPETMNIQKEDYISQKDIINISEYVAENGILEWKAPAGNWKIMRFGHTTTGQENETGGVGKGLEVDKFDTEAIKFQFQKWFGKSTEIAGEDLVPEVLSILHIDSWEAGSQNWSRVFREEFKKRRGYDIVQFLPLMAGIPIENEETSEQVLYDVRKTISDLIVDHFFGTMKAEADKLGVKFSSENVAPTMVSDALMHFKNVDYPGGEFWLNSPTHDKPNDMLDAISGGHIYGKNIIQAEAFTQLRMDWNEDPQMLKRLGDLNYALGINRFFYHVFVHNPWLDRKPGMTLDNIGTYIQRDQTWWEPGAAWMEYCRRVQFQLQKGKPVVDLAVFTGEELPSRSVLPDRLLPFIPNIFGDERLASEQLRLENEGQPTSKMPKEVTYSKNITDMTQWVNSMNGYKYDSFNPDVLLNDARVVDGKVRFKGEIDYKALLFPGTRNMSPNSMISTEVAKKILQLIENGATVFVAGKPVRITGFSTNADKQEWQEITDKIWSGFNPGLTAEETNSWKIGNGKVIQLPYMGKDFSEVGVEPDVLLPDLELSEAGKLAWNHRSSEIEEIYFLSNQSGEEFQTIVSFRTTGRVPYLYDPLIDETTAIQSWKVENDRTLIPLNFSKDGALFIIFREKTANRTIAKGDNWSSFESIKTLSEDWELKFYEAYHGPSEVQEINQLFDWSNSENKKIKYYSGTSTYTKTFKFKGETENIWLDLGEFSDIAEVVLNGKNVGVIWTFPHRIDISEALKNGKNTLEVKISNTWANRLIGDHLLPEKERLTWRMADFRLSEEELNSSGLLGPVILKKRR